MSDVIPLHPRRSTNHPAGRLRNQPNPVVRVVDGHMWTSGASLDDVRAALTAWDTLTRHDPTGPPTGTVLTVPAPRGDDAS